MPKPNYAFAKRQKELAKKQKKEAKLQQKAAARQAENPQPEGEAEAAPPVEPPVDK